MLVTLGMCRTKARERRHPEPRGERSRTVSSSSAASGVLTRISLQKARTVVPAEDSVDSSRIGLAQDFTQGEAKQENLRPSEIASQAFVRTSPDTLVRVASDGSLLEIRAASRAPLVIAPEDCAGKKLNDLMPESVATEFLKCVQTALRTREIQYLKYNLQIQGEVRNWEARLLPNEEDEVLIMASDITAGQRAEDENATIAEIGRIINSSLQIDEVYGNFSGALLRILPFDWVSVNTFDLESETTTIAYQRGPDVPGRMQGDEFPVAGTITQKVALSRQAQVTQVEDVDETAGREHESWGLRAGACEALSVPLIYRQQVIAVFHFVTKLKAQYGPKEVELAVRVGNQITGAIANAQLYAKQLQAEAQIKASLDEKRCF